MSWFGVSGTTNGSSVIPGNLTEHILNRINSDQLFMPYDRESRLTTE